MFALVSVISGRESFLGSPDLQEVKILQVFGDKSCK